MNLALMLLCSCPRECLFLGFSLEGRILVNNTASCPLMTLIHEKVYHVILTKLLPRNFQLKHSIKMCTVLVLVTGEVESRKPRTMISSLSGLPSAINTNCFWKFTDFAKSYQFWFMEQNTYDIRTKDSLTITGPKFAGGSGGPTGTTQTPIWPVRTSQNTH